MELGPLPQLKPPVYWLVLSAQLQSCALRIGPCHQGCSPASTRLGPAAPAPEGLMGPHHLLYTGRNPGARPRLLAHRAWKFGRGGAVTALIATSPSPALPAKFLDPGFHSPTGQIWPAGPWLIWPVKHCNMLFIQEFLQIILGL